MKTSLVILIALASFVFLHAAEKKTTLEGKLVSASCYLPDKSPGATGDEMGGNKHCGSGCLRQGKPGGLLTKEKAFYILDAPSLRLAPYVGQEIRVAGEQVGADIFLPDSVSVKRGDGWESVDLKYHPEK
jgi:hypothetical protein